MLQPFKVQLLQMLQLRKSKRIPINISYEMGVKDGKQQLLESLSEEIDGMYEKCPCGKFNCHGQGNDDALNEVKALIQSKKESLMGL